MALHKKIETSVQCIGGCLADGINAGRGKRFIFRCDFVNGAEFSYFIFVFGIEILQVISDLYRQKKNFSFFSHFISEIQVVD